MYGARFGGSGWVICTSVPPVFWASTRGLATVKASKPKATRTPERILSITLTPAFSTVKRIRQL